MAKTLLLSIAIVALAFVLLGVKVLFIKGGRFPSGHVHSSPELRRRGVACEAHATARHGSLPVSDHNSNSENSRNKE